MKLIVKKTKLGDFFTMTKGYWNNSRTNYIVLGKSDVLFSEIVRLERWTASNGNLITEVVLKTGKGLGLNGYTNSFEIPTEEYDAILEYLTSENDKTLCEAEYYD